MKRFITNFCFFIVATMFALFSTSSQEDLELDLEDRVVIATDSSNVVLLLQVSYEGGEPFLIHPMDDEFGDGEVTKVTRAIPVRSGLYWVTVVLSFTFYLIWIIRVAKGFTS